MAEWFWYGAATAVLYGLHQVFTKLASQHISSAVGGFVVEASAAGVIAIYYIWLRVMARQVQETSVKGFLFSLLTGICVGASTVLFFVLFQRGGPLSAVPAILAGGAALMAVVGMVFLKDRVSWQRLVGVVLALVALYLIQYEAK